MLPKRRGPPANWRQRLSALRNIRPLIKMVWETAPGLTAASVAMRLAKALLPVAMLWVSKLIIDSVVALISSGKGSTHSLWVLVGMEFGLAIASDVLGRGVALADSLLGDRFTNQVSVKLMLHASRLDLTAFEDPVFYDKLERARRQTTGRLSLVSSLMGICQDFLTLISLSG